MSCSNAASNEVITIELGSLKEQLKGLVDTLKGKIKANLENNATKVEAALKLAIAKADGSGISGTTDTVEVGLATDLIAAQREAEGLIAQFSLAANKEINVSRAEAARFANLLATAEKDVFTAKYRFDIAGRPVRD